MNLDNNYFGVKMKTNVVNFAEKRSVLLKKHVDYARRKNHLNTINFANFLNKMAAQTEIDPVHQATLLMAKAVDVLALAGPVPSSVADQHARAGNLLQSIFRARKDLFDKSVRIISAENLHSQMREKDGLSL